MTCEHCRKRASGELHGIGDFRCLGCCVHLVAKAMPDRSLAAGMLAAVDRAITPLETPFNRHDVWTAALKLRSR